MKTWNEKVRMIVEILSRKTNSDFHKFIEDLIEVGQEHVVYVLTGTGSPPMNDAVLTCLRERRNDIIDNMDSVYSLLISTLVSLGVFTTFDKQRVEGEGEIQNRRNERILEF